MRAERQERLKSNDEGQISFIVLILGLHISDEHTPPTPVCVYVGVCLYVRPYLWSFGIAHTREHERAHKKKNLKKEITNLRTSSCDNDDDYDDGGQ